MKDRDVLLITLFVAASAGLGLSLVVSAIFRAVVGW